ncbi:MAG TPA: GH92 family glycosyl hydrolase [Pseudonocardiaceae bacterium]|nr:GH92 family glycosyl hydrolase [Pseudonocardiaceae bacterium]
MKTRVLSVLAASVLVLAGLSTTANAAATPQLVGDPTALVDPFVGTGSGGAVVGPVDMFPGAAAPFGMLDWSPDTPSRPSSGGYNYADSSTIGLSVTHASGAGCGIQGDLPILPTVGAIGTNPTATTEPFTHTDETAHPGSYATKLGTGDSAIGVNVAATTRTGIGQFSYPASTSGNMLFKVGDSQAFVQNASVSIVGNDEVSGSIDEGRFCDMPNMSTVYFVAKFDRPFASYGTWNGTTVNANTRAVTSHNTNKAQVKSSTAPNARANDTGTTGPDSGAYVGFDTTSNATVNMQVSISYVSTANAQANLAAEQHGFNEAATAAQTRAQWRKLLGEISVGGGTHDQQVQFYTALYHALLDPETYSDANGQYLGMDGKVHQTARGQAQYSEFSGWDIYRSEVPLLATVAPAQTSAMAQSLVNDAQQGGWLPKWPVSGGYTGMMGGDSADAILAEAYAFGARDFDTLGALAAMVKGATTSQNSGDLGEGYYEERPGLASDLANGYVVNDSVNSGSAVPDGASLTLEYATDDYSIAAFAQALGQSSTYRTFLGRSQNWTNIYNTESGFLQPRDAKGNFPVGNPVTDGLSSFGQSGFQEGNAAQYAFMVPQDLHGLVTAMGGDAATVNRLDTFFTQDNVGPNDPYYWAGHEVDLEAPWVYDYAGAPSKTTAEVHRLLDNVYADTPDGEPGNDDLGAMSSWYVWGALGLYPTTPGAPVLALSAPIFPLIQLNLPNHATTIIAPGASDQGYINALTVNGRYSDQDWIAAGQLVGGNGGRSSQLAYAISSSPNSHWASADRDGPPSYPAGPLHFPTGSLPVAVTSDPASLQATAGSSSTATLTFALGVGAFGNTAAGIKQLNWTAVPPSGVTVSPASGTATVTNGTATATVSFVVAADAPQGFSSVGFTLGSTPAAALPTVPVPLAVIGTGNTATVCTQLGSTNVDDGISQQEGGDGVTTPVTVGGLSGRSTVLEVQNDLNMYFQVDPRIAHDGDFAATVTIEYYDSGTSGWQLQYDKAGASAYTGIANVTNTNTNTWKTVTVDLPDAAVAEGENNQADFRIASGAPVTVHSVVATISGTGVLPMNLCPSM